MDAIDKKILHMLAANAYATRTAIGEAVGLSVPAVNKRIAKLRERGVIKNFTILTDPVAAEKPIIAYVLLHKTKYGRKIYLVGVNASAAEYSGINSRWIKMSTYILSSVAASITGIIMTSYLGTAKSDLGSSSLTMNIITAMVLGGTLSTGGSGSIMGTVLASLIIGLLRFGMPLCFKINTQYLDIPIGVLLLVVVLGRGAASNPKVTAMVRKLLKKER